MNRKVYASICALAAAVSISVLSGISAVAAAPTAAASKFVPAFSKTLDDSQSSAVKSLDFTGAPGMLVIQQGDHFQIEAGEKIKDYLKYEVKNGVFRCWHTFSGFKGFNVKMKEEDYRIVITLPKKHATYDNVTVEFSSGGGSISQLASKRMSISASSGDVEINSIASSGELALVTSSGQIEIDQAKAGSLKLSTSSGDVLVGKLESAKKVTMDTSSGAVEVKEFLCPAGLALTSGSGSVRLNGNIAGLTADTSSGDVSISGVRGNLDIRAGSGDCTVSVSGQRSNYELNTVAGSGTVYINGKSVEQEYTEGSGRANRINADTGSGSIYIKFTK